MAEPRLMKIDRIKVGEILATGRLRPVSEAGVESLMASIAEVGVMKDAVHVRQKKGGQLVLIAGGHRLEAAKRLGWDEIEAKLWADVTDDWARLMEIDDNIAGAELNPLDTALFLAERKRVCVAKFRRVCWPRAQRPIPMRHRPSIILARSARRIEMSAALIRKVHVGCRQLGIDNDTRRDLQRQVTGKASLSAMSEAELKGVLKALENRGFKPAPKGRQPWRTIG